MVSSSVFIPFIRSKLKSQQCQPNYRNKSSAHTAAFSQALKYDAINNTQEVVQADNIYE
jgi:hypothetical protein